jgi:hypothetical protein
MQIHGGKITEISGLPTKPGWWRSLQIQMIETQVSISQFAPWFSLCSQTDYWRLLCTPLALSHLSPSKGLNASEKRDSRCGIKSNPSSREDAGIQKTMLYYFATFSWDSALRLMCASAQTLRALIHGLWQSRIKIRCSFGKAWQGLSSTKMIPEFIDSTGLWTVFLTTEDFLQTFNQIIESWIHSGTCRTISNGKQWNKALSIWSHLLRVLDICNHQTWFYLLLKKKKLWRDF